jgi:hypothetical protein
VDRGGKVDMVEYVKSRTGTTHVVNEHIVDTFRNGAHTTHITTYCGHEIDRDDIVSGVAVIEDDKSKSEIEDLCGNCAKSLPHEETCRFPGCSGGTVNTAYCRECRNKTKPEIGV